MSTRIDSRNYMSWINPATGLEIYGPPGDIWGAVRQAMYASIPDASSRGILEELMQDWGRLKEYLVKTAPPLTAVVMAMDENFVDLAAARSAVLESEEPPSVVVTPDYTVTNGQHPVPRQETPAPTGFPWGKVFWGIFIILPVAAFGMWIYRRKR